MAVFQCDRAGFVHRRDVTILSKTRAINDMFIDRVSVFARISNSREIKKVLFFKFNLLNIKKEYQQFIFRAVV